MESYKIPTKKLKHLKHQVSVEKGNNDLREILVNWSSSGTKDKN
jgi:hypothetical protein